MPFAPYGVSVTCSFHRHTNGSGAANYAQCASEQRRAQLGRMQFHRKALTPKKLNASKSVGMVVGRHHCKAEFDSEQTSPPQRTSRLIDQKIANCAVPTPPIEVGPLVRTQHRQQRTEGQHNHHCAIDAGRRRQAGKWCDQAGQDGGDAEGQIAFDIEGREKSSALMRFGLRYHGFASSRRMLHRNLCPRRRCLRASGSHAASGCPRG